MAAAIPIMLAVKAVQTYEESQGAISAAKVDRSAGYAVASANEDRVRAHSAQTLGEQRAAAVQSGFDANTGSLATVQQQSAGNAELDALTQRYQGRLNAWRDEQQIRNAQASVKGAAVVAGASLLTGGAGAALGNAAGNLLIPASPYW